MLEVSAILLMLAATIAVLEDEDLPTLSGRRTL